MPKVVCPRCKIETAPLWIGDPPADCLEDGQPVILGLCAPAYTRVLEHALRRAVAPDCFDADGKMIPGRLVEALSRQQDATLAVMRKLRAAASEAT